MKMVRLTEETHGLLKDYADGRTMSEAVNRLLTGAEESEAVLVGWDELLDRVSRIEDMIWER